MREVLRPGISSRDLLKHLAAAGADQEQRHETHEPTQRPGRLAQCPEHCKESQDDGDGPAAPEHGQERIDVVDDELDGTRAAAGRARGAARQLENAPDLRQDRNVK